jgi:fumarate reductase subunit D
MEAIAQSALDETHWNAQSRQPTPEFTYKSGTRVLEGYTVKRGLGWGGFGEVYYALSDGGKEVALKLVQRYLDIELRGVAQCLNLKHPNLLQIFDVRKSPGGENWIVMEYIAGPSLQHRLAEVGKGLPAQEALAWLDGIARAIDFLHQQGIVHRDLKPGNVFQEAGVIKVGDYGLSKFISTSRRSGQTQSVGTVHYMAPEISTGNYGKNVDVYSAAVIAFEMLNGDVPFDGETTGEVLMKHLTAEPALDKVEAKYRSVFAKALAKDPKDRYQSVSELCDAIRAAAGDANAPAPVTPATRTTTPVRTVPAATPLGISLPPPPGTLKAKRRAASDLCWSLFQAGLLSMVLPVLILAANITMDLGIDLVRGYVSLAVLSGIASGGILVLARIWHQTRMDGPMRRLTMLLFGLAMGTTALSVNLWLHDQVPAELVAFVVKPELSEEAIRQFAPVLLIFGTVFALVFAIPDWAKSALPNRPIRFSVWRVLLVGALALIVAQIFQESSGKGPDPFWLSGILASTAVIVQWVSRFETVHNHARRAGRFVRTPHRF